MRRTVPHEVRSLNGCATVRALDLSSVSLRSHDGTTASLRQAAIAAVGADRGTALKGVCPRPLDGPSMRPEAEVRCAAPAAGRSIITCAVVRTTSRTRPAAILSVGFRYYGSGVTSRRALRAGTVQCATGAVTRCSCQWLRRRGITRVFHHPITGFIGFIEARRQMFPEIRKS